MSEQKGLRFNTGKVKLGLVPASLSEYTAYGLMYGAQKYTANNWRKGLKWSELIESLRRHLDAIERGEDIDEESGLPHLCLIGCNTAFLIEHYDLGLGTDDRFKDHAGRKRKQPFAIKAPPGKPVNVPSFTIPELGPVHHPGMPFQRDGAAVGPDYIGPTRTGVETTM